MNDEKRIKIINLFIERMERKGIDNLSEEEVEKLLNYEEELKSLVNVKYGEEMNNNAKKIMNGLEVVEKSDEEVNNNIEEQMTELFKTIDISIRSDEEFEKANKIISYLEKTIPNIEDTKTKSDNIEILCFLHIYKTNGEKIELELIKKELVSITGIGKTVLNNLFKKQTKQYFELLDNLIIEKHESEEIIIGEIMDCPKDIAHLKLPSGYNIIGDNIYLYDKKIFNELFFISKIIIENDVNGVYTHFELIFKRNGRWERVLGKREEIKNHNKIVQLARYNFPISSIDAFDKCDFLNKFESTNIHLLQPKKLVTTIGWNENDELITNEGIFDGEMIVENNEELYFDKTNPLDKTFEFEENKESELLTKTIEGFIGMNESKITIPIISWFLASTVSPYIRNTSRFDTQFPLLNIWGTKGSGKTSTVDIIRRIFGIIDEIRSFSTAYTMLYQLSLTNCIPTIYDEYLPSEMKQNVLNDFHSNVKNAYRSLIVEKGNKTMKVTKYKLIRPLCFIGEDTPTNDAVKDRTLVVQVENNKYNENTLEQNKLYNYLITVNLKKVAYFIWKFIHNFVNNNDFEQLIEESYNFTSRYFQHLSARARINTTTIVIGYKILNSMMEFYGYKKKLYNEKDLIEGCNYANKHLVEERSNFIDKIMIAFANNFYKTNNLHEVMYVDIKEEEGEKKYHLNIKKSTFKNILNNEKHNLGVLYSENILNSTLKDTVKEQNSYILHHETTRKYYIGNSNNKSDNKVKSIVVDLNKLSEQTDIDLDMFYDLIKKAESRINGEDGKEKINNKIIELKKISSN